MIPLSRSNKGSKLTAKSYVLIALFVFVISGMIFSLMYLFPNVQSRVISRNLQEEIQELWLSRNYDQLIHLASKRLDLEPLDYEFLFLRGASYYYSAQNQADFQIQLNQFEQAITDLRRSLLLPHNTYTREIHYLLGKAYYHKGYYFFDSSYFHLQMAESLGYHQEDSYEYLGLVSAELGNVDEGISYLAASFQENRRPILLLTIARLYSSVENFEAALNYSQRAFDESADSFEQEQALLISGAAYRALSAWQEAENVYRTLFDLNPMSADAKFYLGEVFAAQGDYVQARVYWRDAFSINPSHPGAISRLNS